MSTWKLKIFLKNILYNSIRKRETLRYKSNKTCTRPDAKNWKHWQGNSNETYIKGTATCSCPGNTAVTMSVLSELTCGVHAIPVTVPAGILGEIDELILKFVWKGQKYRLNSLEKAEQSWGNHVSIELQKPRLCGICKRTGLPISGKHQRTQKIYAYFDEGAPTTVRSHPHSRPRLFGEETNFFTRGLRQWACKCKKINLDPQRTPYTKINFK